MRHKVDQQRLNDFLHAFAAAAEHPVKVFLTGGASAVLLGWRPSTIDIGLLIVPESDRMLREIPVLKERMKVNLELASLADFIPELSGWQTRSGFIMQEGAAAIFRYDFYAQALAKIERFHELDLVDVREMLCRNLIEPQRLLELFESIAPLLYRFPAIDPDAFRRNVEIVLGARSAH